MCAANTASALVNRLAAPQLQERLCPACPASGFLCAGLSQLYGPSPLEPVTGGYVNAGAFIALEGSSKKGQGPLLASISSPASKGDRSVTVSAGGKGPCARCPGLQAVPCRLHHAPGFACMQSPSQVSALHPCLQVEDASQLVQGQYVDLWYRDINNVFNTAMCALPEHVS